MTSFRFSVLIFAACSLMAQNPPVVPPPTINGQQANAIVPIRGDVSTNSGNLATVLGLNNVPFCNPFNPVAGQYLQYATNLSPSPCWTTAFAVGSPDLMISMTHTGNFTQGQTGATYTVTVSNSGGTATSGTVTAVDVLPSGLTATAISGTGWSCTLGSLTCTRTDALAVSASYPAITVTVNVAGTAGNLVNSATIAGGGESNTANDTANDATTVIGTGTPDMTITSTHSGSFTQGQVGAIYTLTARNSGVVTTSGTVTVVDTLPSSMTATSLSGTGWSCTLGTLTCTRSDALATLTSYPALTLTVTVASNAPASATNSVVVSGGSETNTSNDSAVDATTISVTPKPDLTITKTHTGNFTQGQTGATYTITVSNAGTASTSGTVTMVDTLPTGMTATGLSGTGWTCTLATKTCTRTDALAANASYPALTLTVTVAGNAGSSLTNTATVSGGGEVLTSNDSAPDVTGITSTGVPISDTLNQGTLNSSLWTFVNPNGGTQSMTGTQLQLNVPGGDNHDPEFTGTDQSVRVTQGMGNVDFVSTVRFDSIPNSQYQFEGMMIRQDTNSNFIRTQISSDGTNLICNADIVLGGSGTNMANTTISGSPSSVWLSIQRVGNNWTLAYSVDGTNYNTVGSFSQALTINEMDIWGGNFNAVSTNSPPFTVLARTFTGAAPANGGGGTGGSGSCGLGTAGSITSSGPITLGSGCSGSVIENVHFTSSGSAPCITINGATNITIHNSEIGTCGNQGISISGGSNIKIVDNWIHPESSPQDQNDTGDGVLAVSTNHLTIQGNIICYGADNISIEESDTIMVKGNFLCNARNAGARGVQAQSVDSTNVTYDSNYGLASNDTNTYKFAGIPEDFFNAGAFNGSNSGPTTMTNNYVTGHGGNLSPSGCGLIADSNANNVTISNNTVYDTGQCGVGITDGHNQVVSNNKIYNTNPVNGGGNTGISVANIYQNQNPPSCTNVSVTGNIVSAITSDGQDNSIYYPGDNTTYNCTPVTFSGNTTGSAAISSLTPVSTKLPPPPIPPVPYSCTVKYTNFVNNLAVSKCQ